MKIIGPLSKKAKEAMEKELKNPIYQGMDEDLAVYKAAQALVKKEADSDCPIFDIHNPADQILLCLTEARQQ